MAVDGSFSLESELQRFLDRCPKLKAIPSFGNLLAKGDKITEDEVVLAAGELVLHPNYTIPLLGCFRPIAQRIVERSVHLLHLVPNLRLDDDSNIEDFDEEVFLREDEDVDSPEVARVIDVYVRRRKGLRLHELACLAFCRALDLIPFLLGSILNYFKVAPAPFERIVQCTSVSKALAGEPSQLLNVVRVSYRFLTLEPAVFTTLWDWSCFLDIVQQSADLTVFNDATLRTIFSDLRWCSAGILSRALRLSFKASANLNTESEEAFKSYMRWQEFCMDVSLEKGGWHLEYSADDYGAVGRKDNSCSSMIDKIVPWNHFSMQGTGSPKMPFVLTSALRKGFEMVSLAVSQRWPVLLYGPAGGGKTALIFKLAHNYGSRVLSIHMEEQVDGKTLLGTYVCTEKPGEFRWQPGSLTQAVLNGFWVVFEDIDKAPSDIMSILLPLLEGAVTFSTGHGEAVRVNPGFRLFSTVTSSNPDASCFSEGRNSLGAVWRKIMIAPPSKQDLIQIILQWYPELEYLALNLIETFERVNELTNFQLGLMSSSISNGRFTLRDLLKFCKRVASLLSCSGHETITSYTCENICKEAIDVFASFSTSAANRLAIMRDIARLWGVVGAETLYPLNKPVIQELKSEFRIGRCNLQHAEMAVSDHIPNRNKKPFVELRSSAHALERIACSVKFNEPVLLVGETGTGKTTLVQILATRLGQKLTVLNLSQQSDVADLLGGFKPVDAGLVCVPLYQEFVTLFINTFPSKDNNIFLTRMRKFVDEKNWKMLLSGFQKCISRIIEIRKPSSGKKRKRPLSEELLKAWEIFSANIERAHAQVSASDGMVFSFVEGAFIRAMKNGEWVLLDEVNLAPPEIMQRVTGVLENERGSVCLAERGDIEYIHRHPNFRIFACMNPATDAGKRDLAVSLRSRFTEYFVDDVLDDEDLVLFINQFIDDDPSYRKLVCQVMKFYKAAKESEERLQDGANQKPHYSLRSLYRGLEYLKKAKRKFGLEKSIYDGFCMFFMNSLDDPSARSMNALICKELLGGRSLQPLPYHEYLAVKTPSKDNDILKRYVLTESVEEHLKNLARAIFIGRYPVLLQGPTSSGKTSLVCYLAAVTGHEFVRINNHEHTDLQEYLGSYITDASGKLAFHEGVLVKAVRKGQWIVLDELNLAPSDVLEALNRLLDDNRELFVPELQDTIRAHPDFMLFATQNPPGVYAGRKMLSRAFRNRFVEIHVDEIPQKELVHILYERCKVPQSYAKKMVDVMRELHLHRQSSNVFAGKHGYITPRDLFRWADRYVEYVRSYEDLAYDGYYLMAERLRDDAEKRVVKEVLEKLLKVQLFDGKLYKQVYVLDSMMAIVFLSFCLSSLYLFLLFGGVVVVMTCHGPLENDVLIYIFFFRKKKAETIFCSQMTIKILKVLGSKIIWTKSLWRMYFLVERCYQMREPVLLVGETGGGKTTVCQLLSIMKRSKLHILNCHQYTETSDFLGGFYPVRERSKISLDYQNLCEKAAQSKAFIHFSGDSKISLDINQASQTLNVLSLFIKSYKELSVLNPEVTMDELKDIEIIKEEMCQLLEKWRTIFTWQDGPLVEAMKSGDLFLLDEISLADDSVLERLNSVLEPERKLYLAEKGGSDLENIFAHENFFLLATMNPGGDYGKKELSPALRNRFTEIWVPSVTDIDELKSIATERILEPKLPHIVDAMLSFWEWFNLLQTGRILTVRDLLSWVSFINVSARNLTAESALIHGAFLVLLDGLSLGSNISKVEAAELRVRCLAFLLEKLKENATSFDPSGLDGLESYGWADPKSSDFLTPADNMECDNLFGIHPFYIEKGSDCVTAEGFQFLAPTTQKNTMRVLRAMQLNKPVLLEGSPGVGKTSLVAALGRFSGHTVVRINLSEQTDIMDLLGSDLPIESDEGMQFAWSDGILLQALKNGSWVCLDELNLAPQSVLEGLNAILDHRAEVFIPELGRSFKCPSSFRVFACQNPSYQGGGRKGLPKSFLNRFTKVYVDELVDEDYLSICSTLFPSLERSLLLKLIMFNKKLYQETMMDHKFGQDGSPWEFNLRDVIRSCQIIEDASGKSKVDSFLSAIYLQRMRTSADRVEVMKLYEQTFGLKPCINLHPKVMFSPDSLIVGDVSIERYQLQSSGKSNSNLKILPGLRHSIEAITRCLKHQWLCTLVGPPASGKTSLVRLLAELTGNVLNELNLSSASDISEILGSFEQYNASRHYHLVVARVERYMNEYCNLRLESSSEAFIQRKDISARWLAFLSKTNSLATLTDNPITSDSMVPLVEIIECLKLDHDKQALPLSWSQEDLDSTLDMIRKLEDHHRSQKSVKFEWVTGSLIKAIENGEWIVLENANLCNPTVLDRINSLVEQSGSITINECGTVEGKPVILHPHPKFRMFLTVNPSYGEVSRAMRNRGVEIYMMQPDWLPDHICPKIHSEMELREIKRFIALSGIPMGRLVDMMTKAHLFAKHEGSHFNISITYLELSRWVQLFQRLITNGNQTVWSIQISWEHTYLSSFGEEKGRKIVSEATSSYLSMSELYKVTSSEDYLLCLPGGWPNPLKLSDFVYYSKYACVRQNIMYLESLGNEIASSSCIGNLKRVSKVKTPPKGGSKMIHLMDAMSLHGFMFPKETNCFIANDNAGNELQLVLSQKKQKLYFAADWVMEQVTDSDYCVYIWWFEWFGSALQSSLPFFSWFSDLLKKELQHSIWTRIFQLRTELLSRSELNVNSISSPILSVNSIDVFSSGDVLNQHHILLRNLIKCVRLLRHSLQQWSKENEYNHGHKTKQFEPILTSLRRMEEKVLDFFVESPSFDMLFRSYTNLLEHHMLFWNSINPPQIERRVISWQLLLKDAVKLKDICPAESEQLKDILMIEIRKLENSSSLCLNSSKSLLWKHGGHPILPSSADLHQKQCQFADLCEEMWPRVNKFMEPGMIIYHILLPDINSIEGNQFHEVAVDGILFPDVELRILAMQGVCMSTYIIDKVDDIGPETTQQLDEMHQMLSERWDFEKQKLKVKLESTKLFPALCSACCSVTPDILHIRSGLDCWIRTQPIVDETSLCLDLELLKHLTQSVVVDLEEQHNALLDLSELLKSSLGFSLNYSARPLIDFLPHQKILWTLDAWESVKGANEKISSFTLEMWFRWHATLWEVSPILAKALPQNEECNIVMPQKLFWPLKLTMVDEILKNADPIRDYHLHKFKLRATCRSIWQSSENLISSGGMFLSAARSLFQQIICAHKKSFEDSRYVSIKTVLCSIQELSNPMENIKALISLLASSNHRVFTSLINSYIEPLLTELYAVSPSDDILSAGFSLLRIGGLRYNLLVRCDDLDPTLKYSIKYSELTAKIASLELEIEVRQECIYLAGNSHHQMEDDSYKINMLDKLKAERRMLRRKLDKIFAHQHIVSVGITMASTVIPPFSLPTFVEIYSLLSCYVISYITYAEMVFRPNPGKFKELKYLCNDFLKSVTAIVEWIKNVKSLKVEQVSNQVHNWQDMTSHFIYQLSKCSEYVDITEPVQVAIYEIKLGLSLIVSDVLGRSYLPNGEQSIESVLSTLHKFVRFPRVCASKRVSIDVGRKAQLSINDIDWPTIVEETDLYVLQNMVELTGDTVSARESHATPASTLPFKVSVYHNILDRLKESIAGSGFLSASSFKLLHEIFHKIASLWMKHRAKSTDDGRSELFKFRSRTFKMESILEIDVSNCAILLANDSFSEWQELLSEELDDKIRVNEEDEGLEQEWNAQESDLDGIVNIHNQLFGSIGLIQRPCSAEVSDVDRLSSFCNSYMLGMKLTRDLRGLCSSSFDAKIAPEHLLRLCLEHDDKFILHKSTCAYNFYKALSVLLSDSNSPMLAKLVEPVTHLKQRIIFLLKEWDDHTVHHLSLMKIVEVVDMILALPLDTPLAKALSALEFLINRIRNIQETVAKFPISDQLEPIFALVSAWHRLEFEAWPSLLDEVKSHFVKNAGKLWFPLYSVFLRGPDDNVDQYTSSMIERQASQDNYMEILMYCKHCSHYQEENVKILYNTFGFYVQLLPRVQDHIDENRKSIEKELNELLKLCRWDRADNHLAIETFKRTRLKLRKIVKKYMDLLQQPLMEFIGQESSRSMISNHPSQKFMLDQFDVIKTILDTACNEAESIAKNSSAWFADWWKRLAKVGEISGSVKDDTPPQSSCFYSEAKEQLWYTIEKLCATVVHCGEFWEDKAKKSGKKRAFAELLNLLDSCGLSKHRKPIEGQSDRSHSWLLQPSYELQHLLLRQSEDIQSSVDIFHPSFDTIWRMVNKFYFKNVASFKILEKICLNFHKDLQLIEIERSSSYVDHLIEIQQEQRVVAYNSGDSDFSKNQCATFKCMWSQKQLIDGFCTLLYEEHLLLQKVVNNHLDTCSLVKREAEKIRAFIQKVLPDFQKSKNKLDQHLLGSCKDITVGGVALHCYGVTGEMEEQVNDNFKLINTFEKDLLVFSGHGAVKILLGHFEDLFAKAHDAEEFHLSSLTRKSSENADFSGEKDINELETDFETSLKQTNKRILSILQTTGSPNCDSSSTEQPETKMMEWKIMVEKDIELLQLDLIYEDVTRTIQCAGELLNYSGESANLICTKLRKLHILLDMILAFGDKVLQDFLVAHRMVSKVTYGLTNVLASLFMKGFGTIEEQENDNSNEMTQDASGTGMSEGAGVNDVSDQIQDEDQLLGASDKPNEERKDDMPSKNEKGIEMEQEFDGDMFSVSEDSGDDENNENEDDEQIESAMGEVGDKSDVVDEKLGDTNEDEDRSANEKYEQGASVKDQAQDEELRAKEDSEAMKEDAIDLDAKEADKPNEENGDEEGADGEEDMKVDKDDAYADPTGLNPDVEDKTPEEEEAPGNELDGSEPMEEGETEDVDDSDAQNEEKADEFMEEADPENPDGDGPGNDKESDAKMPEQDVLQSDPNDNAAQSAGKSTDDFAAMAEQGDSAPDDKYSESELKDNLAPTNGQPNASDLEVRVADSTNGQQLSHEQSQTSLTPSESRIQKAQPNPCRSIGDALDRWKERVKVSVDLPDQVEKSDDMVEDADEYGYTAEFKEGTAQALGPATAEQVKGDIAQNETEIDVGGTDAKDHAAEIEIEKSNPETYPIANSAVYSANYASKQQGTADMEQDSGDAMEVDDDYSQDGTTLSDSLVSVKKSYINEEIRHIRTSAVSDDDDELGKGSKFEPSVDTRDEAAILWRRYESRTTRLSQELAEQLRLAMEPTLASKLQGDYRTGKRINIKKVIQYIASHYRKDRIWLRRMKPSKRDYQVMIAVDDSASMSEGSCGRFAMEALVTVCRAMSQLEVGNLAVASFGKQGNIRLLHDFDQPFTPEAGIKMMSSFTFKQENTIADEPMVDLLKYVNNMLDTAVMQARSPSGCNPLEQLVLIIADGRFNEKEKLKRRVRDILSTKRMVAFLLLDSPNESIMDLQEFTGKGTEFKLSRYIDSFPFPYYVVLKNIEALPRTLADLLRQWFELMQYSRD
ncbi:hypothetical protein SASPL_139412 [Salvia splendens]|uniref:Midasin n=1 Tax=Salvia splendens TaxID=180675 RepID=A0A8X8ZAD8_SALSN|nr:hypothetical protein SASPL_139412 [Salvia splendens]